MADPHDQIRSPEMVRWTVGCLVAAAAMVGLVILLLLVAFILTPPVWVQVLLGVALAAGGAAFAWLVASALGQGWARDQRRRGPRRLEEPGERPPAG